MKSLQINFLKILFCLTLFSMLPGFQTAYAGSVSVNSNPPSYEVDLAVKASDWQSLSLYTNPALTWNTFLGNNNGTDYGFGITADGSGNVYVTGISNAAWGTPVRGYTGASDAFVAKLDSTGNLIWNTFLGGSVGNDYGEAIAVDGSGNIYITGLTDVNSGSGTWGNPIRAFMGQGDAFVAKLDSSGNLVWNTFLGSGADDWGKGLVVTASGNVYVAGTSSAVWGGPTVRAYTALDDAFVASLDSSGNLIWNSFLGGNGIDIGDGIAMDVSGGLYVTGYSIDSIVSASWGNPIRNYLGGDAFIAKLDSIGNLTWNTFLGSNGNDQGYAIALDQTGNIYVTGISDTTWGNPVRGYSANLETFVGKLDSSGNLSWNTFLGGNGVDFGYAIDTDTTGEIYVAGYSTTSWGNPSHAFTAPEDAFVTKLDLSGNLMLNTFLGGSGYDYGYGIEVQGNGNVYMTGSSTGTWGSPVSAYTPPTDAFVVIPDLLPPLVTSTSLKTVMSSGPSNFTITFSEDVDNPVGNTNINDVTNPDNYLLVNTGANGSANTVSCANNILSDDTKVIVTSVAYDVATSIATVTLASSLPIGKYRLLVCGTTSIVDLAGNVLAGNGLTTGTDYIFDFTVEATGTSIPSTGFAANVISRLPVQPAEKAYVNLDSVWLEIPSQKIKTNIVGVPKTGSRWDVTWLGNNVGWLNGTAFPSWEGNSVLTAHVYNANGRAGPFARLKDLKYGDKIIVHLDGEKYIFEVRSTRLTRPPAARFAFQHLEDHSFLTLITCEGYNERTDSYTYRRIVRAVLVDVQSDK